MSPEQTDGQPRPHAAELEGGNTFLPTDDQLAALAELRKRAPEYLIELFYFILEHPATPMSQSDMARQLEPGAISSADLVPARAKVNRMIRREGIFRKLIDTVGWAWVEQEVDDPGQGDRSLFIFAPKERIEAGEFEGKSSVVEETQRIETPQPTTPVNEMTDEEFRSRQEKKRNDFLEAKLSSVAYKLLKRFEALPQQVSIIRMKDKTMLYFLQSRGVITQEQAEKGEVDIDAAALAAMFALRDGEGNRLLGGDELEIAVTSLERAKQKLADKKISTSTPGENLEELQG